LARGKKHWAFQAFTKPKVPQVKNKAWVRNPVDAFILTRLEEAGLKPAPTANRNTLLRRVYFDLIGLPPTPEEVSRFVADTHPGAYERVVDDLLSRPQYGERWARHWLDVVRYAETNGYERDGTKPNAWRYRDYVIQSLNADKPFSRFLMEQVAGDELPDTNAEAQIATTFLRLGLWDDEPADEATDRYDQLDDVLGTVSTAFLGVTLKCARCHDHKFEPFSQRDYYKMLAVFEPLKRPQFGRVELDRLVGTAQELQSYSDAVSMCNARLEPVAKPLFVLRATILRRLIAAKKTSVPESIIGAIEAPADKRTQDQIDLVAQKQAQFVAETRAAATPEEASKIDQLADEVANIEREKPAEPPRAYIWMEDSPTAKPTHIFHRGDPSQIKDAVLPGAPRLLEQAGISAPKSLNTSTGRRTWLAEWMTRSDNPLTSRVIVNRIWQHHFQDGLVKTSNDFGLMGAAPTHPELLNWLARTFVDEGWSVKKLHRLILTSNTYKMSSRVTPQALQADARNALYSRYPEHRLQAEAVRDAVLAASGQLNQKAAGPSVYPDLPRAVLEGQSRPGDGWGKSDEKEASRRSIYIFSKRSLAVPELEVLDSPDTTCSVEQRPVSTIAPQALTFLNGEFINRQAKYLAQRLKKEAGEKPEEQVQRAFWLCVARQPSTSELSKGVKYLLSGHSLVDYCLVMLNLNEFVYVR
jgi:hypothetical protein